jgi:hypothetical protein
MSCEEMQATGLPTSRYFVPHVADKYPIYAPEFFRAEILKIEVWQWVPKVAIKNKPPSKPYGNNLESAKFRYQVLDDYVILSSIVIAN